MNYNLFLVLLSFFTLLPVGIVVTVEIIEHMRKE